MIKTQDQEIIEAQEAVEEAEEALSEAENKLQRLLKKYHLEDANERDISNMLPTMAFFAGMRLTAVKEGGTVYLRDKNGEEIKKWLTAPSLTELFETCEATK